MTAAIEAPETLADTSIPRVIDKAKYFNVLVDDVDRRQAAGDIMEYICRRPARRWPCRRIATLQPAFPPA